MPFKGGDRMSEQGSDPSSAELLRQRTLSRWDNEQGLRTRSSGLNQTVCY